MPDENKKFEKKLVKKYGVLFGLGALIRQVPSVLGPF